MPSQELEVGKLHTNETVPDELERERQGLLIQEGNEYVIEGIGKKCRRMDLR